MQGAGRVKVNQCFYTVIIQFFIHPHFPKFSAPLSGKIPPSSAKSMIFFGKSVLFLVQYLPETPPWLERGENFENVSFWISGKCLSGVFLVHFLHFISAFFVMKLVAFVFSYNMSNIDLVFKEHKIFFRSFLVRLGENFLEFYLILIVLFFDGKNKQIKFW